MIESDLIDRCVVAFNRSARESRPQVDDVTRKAVRAILVEAGLGGDFASVRLTPQLLTNAAERLSAAINANLATAPSGAIVHVRPYDLKEVLVRAYEPAPTKRTMQDVIRDLDAARNDRYADVEGTRRLTDELIELAREETAR